MSIERSATTRSYRNVSMESLKCRESGTSFRLLTDFNSGRVVGGQEDLGARLSFGGHSDGWLYVSRWGIKVLAWREKLEKRKTIPVVTGGGCGLCTER